MSERDKNKYQKKYIVLSKEHGSFVECWTLDQEVTCLNPTKGYSRKKHLGEFFYPTTHGIQFPQTPTTNVIRKFRTPTTHRIKFSSEGPMV